MNFVLQRGPEYLVQLSSFVSPIRCGCAQERHNGKSILGVGGSDLIPLAELACSRRLLQNDPPKTISSELSLTKSIQVKYHAPRWVCARTTGSTLGSASGARSH